MATAPLTMADYLRMANTVGEKPGLSYNDYVTLAYLNGSDPATTGASSGNPGFATGSAYASPDRYNQYMRAQTQFMDTNRDKDINAYIDAHPEYLQQVQQQLEQQRAGAGWGVDYNPTDLMNATGGMDPRQAAYQALLSSTYAPPGNPTDNAGWQNQTPVFEQGDPYQKWIATLTPSQQAEYDQVVNANFSKGTATMRGAFIAVLAAMTAGGALAAMGTEAAAAGLGAQAGMSASEITAANLAAQTASQVAANAGITAGMSAAEAAAAMEAYVAAGGAASVGTAGLSASELAAKALAEKTASQVAANAGLTSGMTAEEAAAAMDAFAKAGGAGGAAAPGIGSEADWYLNEAGNPMTSEEYAKVASEALKPAVPPTTPSGNEADWYNNPDGTPMSPEEYAKVAEEALKPVTPPTGNEADWYNNPDGTPMSPEDYAKVAEEALKPGIPSIPKLPSIPNTGGGTGGGTDWGSILGGAGLGAAAIAAIQGINNSQDLPAIPDYLKLAEQTAADKTRATNEQTLANRPNQTNAMGDTSQWTKDPVTGAWSQKVAFGAPQQAKFDETNTMLSALRGQIGSGIGKPLDMSAFQTPGAKDPYAGVDLSKLQPAGYTPQGSSQIMQDILRTKKVI